MAIVVTCPGCNARFQVADKHGGKKGPCPKCKAVIPIPNPEPQVARAAGSSAAAKSPPQPQSKPSREKEAKPASKTRPKPQAKRQPQIRDEDIKIHVPDGYGAAPGAAGAGKPGAKGHQFAKPIEREDLEWQTVPAVITGAVIVGVVVIDWFVGQVLAESPLLYPAVMGLIFVVSIPLSVVAYWILLNREFEPHRGMSLWIRALICGSLYTSLWIARGFIPPEYTEYGWNWVFIAPFFFGAGSATALVTQDLEWGEAFFHFCFFLGVSMFLRWIAGVGWF